MLVCPLLEYTYIAWSPYHQCKLIISDTLAYLSNLLNTYRAACLWTISIACTLFGWPTLESRCNTLRTLMMYKSMRNLVDVPTDTILLPSTLQLLRSYNNYLVESMLVLIPFSSSDHVTVYPSTWLVHQIFKRDYIIYINYYYLLTCMTILISESVH